MCPGPGPASALFRAREQVYLSLGEEGCPVYNPVRSGSLRHKRDLETPAIRKRRREMELIKAHQVIPMQGNVVRLYEFQGENRTAVSEILPTAARGGILILQL